MILRVFQRKKNHKFRNEQKGIVKIWGILLEKNNTIHTNIQLNGSKSV